MEQTINDMQGKSNCFPISGNNIQVFYLNQNNKKGVCSREMILTSEIPDTKKAQALIKLSCFFKTGLYITIHTYPGKMHRYLYLS